MVGCDDDGLVIVPMEVAGEVAEHAKAILLADMKGREKRYEALGMEKDETVDVKGVEDYYAGLGEIQG